MSVCRLTCASAAALLSLTACDDPSSAPETPEVPRGEEPVAALALGGTQVPQAASTCGPAVHRASPHEWVVSPSAENTASLGCALHEAAAHGPGAVVRLLAGAYPIGVVEVVGFEGHLVGAGRHETVLSPLAGGVCATPAPTGYPGLLYFRGGAVKISDLTIDNQPPEENTFTFACEDRDAQPPVLPALSIVSTQARPEDERVPLALTLYDIAVRGLPAYVRPAQQMAAREGTVDELLEQVAPSVLAHIAVQHTQLVREPVALVQPGLDPFYPSNAELFSAVRLTDSQVRLGGSCDDANEVRNGGFAVHATGGTDIDVSYNDVELALGGAGVALRFDGETWPAGTARVFRNRIRTGPNSGEGIRILSAFDAPLDIDIARNLVIGDARFGRGVFGSRIPGSGAEFGPTDVIVRENRFEGLLGSAVSLRQGRGWHVVDNDVVDLSPSSSFDVILLEDAVEVFVTDSGTVLDDGIDNTVGIEDSSVRFDVGPACAPVTFAHPRGNLWWVEIDAHSAHELQAVEARVDDARDWVELSSTDWGSYAGSFFVPPGTKVQLRAITSTGEQAYAPPYLWPEAIPVVLDGPLKLRLAHPRGNAWWVEADLSPSEPLELVQVRIEEGARPSRLLGPTPWGSFAGNFYVPPGSTVRFIGFSEGGDEAHSGLYRWPDATLLDPFAVTFHDVGGDEDTVEARVYANEPLAGVDVSTDGGLWQPLPPTEWGSFRRGDLALPRFTTVKLRARSLEGGEVISEPKDWPPR